jgi:hypothetical protein
MEGPPGLLWLQWGAGVHSYTQKIYLWINACKVLGDPGHKSYNVGGHGVKCPWDVKWGFILACWCLEVKDKYIEVQSELWDSGA